MASEVFQSTASKGQDALHYDFCPWANRYVYWLKKPVGLLFAAAATAALLGIYVAAQAMAVSAAVVALIGLGMLWPAIAMKGVHGKLTWQRQRSVEGEPIETILEVTNRWPWPVWGLTVESDTQVVNDGSDRSQSVALACLRPFSTTEFLWDSRPTRRGLYPEKPSFLATGFPFGIWTARAKLEIPRSLLVWPKAIDLHDMPNLSGDERSVTGAWIDKAGHEGDVIGVRQFRDGDSLRNVHWAQSAKSDNLIVCERQSVSRRSIQLSVDYSPESSETTNEWLIRIGASVAKTFLAHQWSVKLEILGTTVDSEPGEPGLRKLMDLLATFDREFPNTTDSSSTGSFPRHGMLSLDPLAVSPKPRKTFQRSVAKQTRKSSSSNTMQFVITTNERVASRNDCSTNIGWILVNDSLQGEMNSTVDVSPWMQIDLTSPVWRQIQSEWNRVCHANASRVLT